MLLGFYFGFLFFNNQVKALCYITLQIFSQPIGNWMNNNNLSFLYQRLNTWRTL